MIAFDLSCNTGHRFEGWFQSSGEYDAQRTNGLLACPSCGDPDIRKVLSIPNIGRKGSQAIAPRPQTVEAAEPVTGEVVNAPTLPPAMMEMMQKMAIAQTDMLKDSQWVGREFAETARAIHYGEEADRLIHGETSADEAQTLAEEGIAVAPLPFPVVPPQAKN